MSQSKLKLGVIGAGFVGSSVLNGFDRNVEQFVVDPKLNKNTIKELLEFSPSLIFVCVPTPASKNKDVNCKIVKQVLSELDQLNFNGITVIKSTITPKHLVKFKKDYKLKIVYNPEFLTEANAHQDFINPHMQILGGKWRDCDTVEKAYNRHSSVKVVPTYKVDLITASLIKYTINSWLATKVVFFNELKQLHETSGAMSSWEQFTEMLGTDPRIGKSHMKVPGPDGKLGFGGHCFPKDTKALVYYANSLGVDMDVLTKAMVTNDKTYRKI